MTRIIIAEDHLIVREGLKLFLSTEPEFQVVAETGDGGAVATLVEHTQPHLLLLDLDLPGCHGSEVAAQVKARFASVKIVVLTGSVDAESVRVALAAGADGYVAKQGGGGELLQAIRVVMSGGQFVSQSIATAFQADATDHGEAGPGERVTAREQEIIAHIARGSGNQDIADALHISVYTVRTHRKNLMDKLGLHNAAEITAYAIKHRLYHPQ